MRLLAFTALLAACAPATVRAPAPVEPRYDLVITGGTVIDGTGAARYRADVAISGDRIALVSRDPIAPSTARRTINATGLIVTPGFIDLHAHIEALLRIPEAESHVRQGVTTALGGPDGGGPWPFGVYLDSAQSLGTGLNVAYLVGHNTIRRRVMELADRDPTVAELAQMRAMVAQAMHEGAFGLSTGLRYLPGTFSKTDEVVALSKVAADSGGIYTSHLREEGLGVIEGVAEAIEIGRRTGITVVLTHHKVIGKQNVGTKRADAGDGRQRAYRRRRRSHRSVSVYGDVHRYRCARADVGARGWGHGVRASSREPCAA